jgi:hypothetical protein
MVAGLLHYHGVQVGEYKVNQDNPKGGFENLHIKNVMKQSLLDNGYDLNPIRFQPTIFKDDPSFKQKVLQGIPDENKPWLCKEFRILMTWPLWLEHFPNAVYVLNRRNFNDNLKSMLKHRVISKRGSTEDLRWWITWARKTQEAIAGECPHVWAYVDEIWKGNLDEAKKVVEGCGLKFDKQKTKEWIEPSLWHNRSGA